MAAPYIMPDGPGGRPYRLTEREGTGKPGRGKPSGTRGKDEAWSSLQARMGSAAAADDLAELRAIARAGWRRRNRWFNDRALREGFQSRWGRMTAEDMAGQFNPPPFGAPAPPSAFELVSAPENQALWNHFRSISMDREEKVLEKWEAHNRQHRGSSPQDGASTSAADAADPAAAALRAWSRVSRAARTALKRASPHTVMEFEHQILDLVEAGDLTAELLIEAADGFGRLLIHGLCEYHGLLSATRNEGGRAVVAVYFRKQQQGQQQQQQAGEREETSGAVGGEESTSGSGGGEAAAAAAAAAAGPPRPLEIHCTDILLALREAAPQGGFDAAKLGRYVHNMHHGSEALSDDFAMHVSI